MMNTWKRGMRRRGDDDDLPGVVDLRRLLLLPPEGLHLLLGQRPVPHETNCIA
jgi:hypothetical protein